MAQELKATFEFKKQTAQRSLFESETGYTEPPAELAEAIMRNFAGRTLTLSELCRLHAHGTKFIERDYRKALLHMEAQGKIAVLPPMDLRRTRNGKPVWGASTKASFPRQ